jgi:hypothetical protein
MKDKIIINEEVKKRIKRQTEILNKRIEKSKGNKILEFRINQDWQDFQITNNGHVYIRCQAQIKGTDKQCRGRAKSGTLACMAHGARYGLRDSKKRDELKTSLGIYQGKGMKALQKDLEEVDRLTPEELQDTTPEVKLAVALLRNLLSSKTDEEIAKNPGQLTWVIGEISRLKKEHYEMKHDTKFSFTRDQVQFLFVQMQLAIMSIIKDPEILEALSNRMREVGKMIEQDGYK